MTYTNAFPIFGKLLFFCKFESICFDSAYIFIGISFKNNNNKKLINKYEIAKGRLNLNFFFGYFFFRNIFRIKPNKIVNKIIIKIML